MTIQENIPLSEQSALRALANPEGRYLPLEILSIKPETAPDRGFDAEVTLGWRGRVVPFLAEIKARTAPKLVIEGIARLKKIVGKRDNVLLVVPFLSKTIVELLEREGVSGLDLSGNYFIQTPDMVAIRLDRGNQFPESQSIKKVFSGNSSLVGRLLLTEKRRFTSVNEVLFEIRRRGGSLSLSAVSKVLTALDRDLIIEKSRQSISLLQPEKLLDRLAAEYRPPKLFGSKKLKLPPDKGGGLAEKPDLKGPFSGTPWVLTGESSASRYGITSGTEVLSVYMPGMGDFAKFDDGRFYNVLVRQTADSFVYFDIQDERWASPVQCYLELAQLGKREQEIAGTIREAILSKLK